MPGLFDRFSCSAGWPRGLGGACIDAHALRRLDWRFLLPEPDLQHVAFIGAQGSTLLTALRAFSECVTVLSSMHADGGHGTSGEKFELVVVESFGSDVLRAARAALAPGGQLYWECSGPNSTATLAKESTRQARISRLWWQHRTTALCQLEFQEVRRHCHYPNFENCEQIISLDEPDAVGYFLAREARPIARQILWMLGHVRLTRSLLPVLLPSVSLVARAPAAVAVRS